MQKQFGTCFCTFVLWYQAEKMQTAWSCTNKQNYHLETDVFVGIFMIKKIRFFFLFFLFKKTFKKKENLSVELKLQPENKKKSAKTTWEVVGPRIFYTVFFLFFGKKNLIWRNKRKEQKKITQKSYISKDYDKSFTHMELY